jgi:hypothetical protein
MKPNLLFPLLLTAAALVSGCRTYDYQIVRPAPGGRIADQPVTIQYEPLQYRLSRQHERLALHISNPTDDRITLRGDRSYVVDPQGESHPVRGRVIGPHSYTRMLLPPEPITYPYYGYGAGWGGGWGGPYSPYWDGFYNDFYYSPSVWYYQTRTPYDWEWKTGLARLHLSYERNGQTFAHDFEFIREREK